MATPNVDKSLLKNRLKNRLVAEYDSCTRCLDILCQGRILTAVDSGRKQSPSTLKISTTNHDRLAEGTRVAHEITGHVQAGELSIHKCTFEVPPEILGLDTEGRG